MSDDADGSQRRRRLIAERLRVAVLPHYRSQRTFGGRGEGTPCACCDEPIARSDVQYEVEQHDAVGGNVVAGNVSEQVRSIPMHLHCYRLWVEESARPDAP